jgi:GWxTD domain-containing protein
MNKVLPIVAAILLCRFSTAFSQQEQIRQRTMAAYEFSMEIANFKAESGDSRADLYVRIRHSALSFLKKDTTFEARYEITFDFFDMANVLVSEKTWTEIIRVPSYEETIQESRLSISTRSIVLQPNTYRVLVQVRDAESEKTYKQERSFTIHDFRKDHFAMSDLLVLSKVQTDSTGHRIRIPNVSDVVMRGKEGLTLFYEIYSTQPKTVQVSYNVKPRNDKSKVFPLKTDTLLLNEPRVQIVYHIPTDSISSGDYMLELQISDSASMLLAKQTKPFTIRTSGTSSYIKNIDKAIEQLVYYASSDDYDYIVKGKSEDERRNRFNAFWKKRDPTPNTEQNEVEDEYYSRVEFANEHFSNNYTEGWKSDRGLIYVKYGDPDYVDRHPFEFNSKPYEIWEYYQKNRRFIFMDYSGFGDYRLMQPEWDSRNRIH